ncbi:MAG: hypothetical protein GTO08_04780 [Deltaproteobacteria bacterium]|nr:hypothetical protein [Deltaproteobacteria bacterium]
MRLDIAVTAISAGMDARGIFNLDLGYAPPYSNALDSIINNIINLSSILENKIKGVGKGLSPLTVKDILSNGRDVLMIDVRTPAEFKKMRINDERVK